MNSVNNSNVAFQKTRDCIAEVLKIDKDLIQPTATFDSLTADSLDLLEIVMKLEDAFNIEIADNKACLTTTVQEMVDYIQNILGH